MIRTALSTAPVLATTEEFIDYYFATSDSPSWEELNALAGRGIIYEPADAPARAAEH